MPGRRRPLLSPVSPFRFRLKQGTPVPVINVSEVWGKAEMRRDALGQAVAVRVFVVTGDKATTPLDAEQARCIPKQGSPYLPQHRFKGRRALRAGKPSAKLVREEGDRVVYEVTVVYQTKAV